MELVVIIKGCAVLFLSKLTLVPYNQFSILCIAEISAKF